uniref:UBC core domain-containing protein n=1 Tax=Ditylenchus dipsaci TaxID=166011 RepID=A0A915CQA0_9BILA
MYVQILEAYIEPQHERVDVHLLPFTKSRRGSTIDEGANKSHSLPAQFVDILSRSCLCQTLHSHLLLKAICTFPCSNDQPDLFVRLFLSPQPVDEPSSSGDTSQLLGHNLLKQLSSLNKHIDIYLSKLSKQHRRADNQQQPAMELDEQSGEEEGLAKLLEISKVACEAIQKKVDHLDRQNMSLASDLSNEQIFSTADTQADLHTVTETMYCSALKPLQFESVAFFEPDGNTLHLPYHYFSSLSAVGQTAGMAKRMRRLAQEVVSLSSSLPLSLSSSVFVRACEERLDAMKVLITGPEGTPYSNGCFEFDVYFPPDFPNSPMLINLETTGNNSVRFNPNLYDDGKVCLSILNTWRGRPEERWNPETSSFMQVIVSIQSLILVNDPYFNEPGYERWRNTPAGQQASREYDANIRQQCEVVLKHFWLKRDELVDQVDGWIKETQSHVDSKVDNSKSLPTYLAGLKRQFNFLKEELARMKAPPGLEHLKSIHFPGSKPSTATSLPDHQDTTVDKVVEQDKDLIENSSPMIIEGDKEGEITWKLVPLDVGEEGEDEASNLVEGVLVEIGLEEAQAN